MCGRYNLITDGQALYDFFALCRLPELTPRYNIAPSQQAPAVRQIDGECRLDNLRWGLIPSWAKDADTRYRMINARAETVAEKPAYRTAFRRRRCLIPATGFFEWQHSGRTRQPYNVHLSDGGLMAFAGLWERWRDAGNGTQIDSFAIIVTDANETVRPVHDRMPVILRREDFRFWLDPETSDTAGLLALLQPAPASAIALYPVSRMVGNPANDVSACVEPIAADLLTNSR